MNGPLLISGLVLGAAGSLHCAGMCGPLCMMLPVQAVSTTRKTFLILSYQLGRILTYSILGAIIGLAGRRFYLTGYQQWFSIGLGSLALLLAILYFFQNTGPEIKFFSRYYRGVQKLVVAALKKAGSFNGSLLLGMANGLLPCGMVYMAILVAVSFSTIGESVLFMALFGAGTLPMMVATAWAGQAIKMQKRLALQKWIPVFIMLTGCLLIIRGLNLGIPFLSPHIMSAHGGTVSCTP
jgi:sulfite exporter TauE/SafE